MQPVMAEEVKDMRRTTCVCGGGGGVGGGGKAQVTEEEGKVRAESQGRGDVGEGIGLRGISVGPQVSDPT